MLRHWVNYGLLFSFLTLTGSGLLSYLKPFSLTTTRVHIVFGFLTIVLVALHLASRTKYFAARTVGPAKSPKMLLGIVLAWCTLLVLSLTGTWPTKPVVEGSYESRNKQRIVRQSALAGVVDIDPKHRLAARMPDQGADTAVSLLVRFRDETAPPPAMAIWAETSTGSLIETLYLDPELAFSEEVKWHGVATRRHHLLPIWRHRHTLVSGVDPLGKVDAFTASTPSHAFTLDQYLKTGDESGFVLCVEVNATHDPNARYPDPTLGQPSLLYTAFIDLDQAPKYHLLELTAHGGSARESGTLEYDFDGIDTAGKPIDLLLAHIERIQQKTDQ